MKERRAVRLVVIRFLDREVTEVRFLYRLLSRVGRWVTCLPVEEVNRVRVSDAGLRMIWKSLVLTICEG